MILGLSFGTGGLRINERAANEYLNSLTEWGKEDAAYANFMKGLYTPCLADTNHGIVRATAAKLKEKGLGTVTTIELGPIATDGGKGSGHSIEVAEKAYAESSAEIEKLIAKHECIILIVTLGKATGLVCSLRAALAAKRLKKLPVPCLFFPALDDGVSDKQLRLAQGIIDEFDRNKIRVIQVNNEAAYRFGKRMPYLEARERLDRAIARSLKCLVNMLAQPDDLDINDLRRNIFVGHGRMYPGAVTIENGNIEKAVMECCENRVYEFRHPLVGSALAVLGNPTGEEVKKISRKFTETVHSTFQVGDKFVQLPTAIYKAPGPTSIMALFSEDTGDYTLPDIEWPDSAIELPNLTATTTPPTGKEKGQSVIKLVSPLPKPKHNSIPNLKAYLYALLMQDQTAKTLLPTQATFELSLGSIEECFNVFDEQRCRLLTPEWKKAILDVLHREVTLIQIGEVRGKSGRKYDITNWNFNDKNAKGKFFLMIGDIIAGDATPEIERDLYLRKLIILLAGPEELTTFPVVQKTQSNSNNSRDGRSLIRKTGDKIRGWIPSRSRQEILTPSKE